MSNWPGKYVIGLTGNIGTGKTVVRRMLEHLGAYTIDADALSHRAIAKGAPGYQPVVNYFGKWILDPQGEIIRSKLGDLVFRDAEALASLEQIVHPLVRRAVNVLIERASQPVIVIEAIKLLEGDLRNGCDSIWVTYAPQQVQIERLTRKRKISQEDALQRITTQASQSIKIAEANVVIHNIGSYDNLWQQVVNAWKTSVPVSEPTLKPVIPEVKTHEFNVTRGKPRDSLSIAGLINRLSGGSQHLTGDDIMAQFGDKAYMLLEKNSNLVGIAGWQVENLIVRTTDLHLEFGMDMEKPLELLIREIENVSADLLCEASFVFPTSDLAAYESIWTSLGYKARTPETLGVQAWTDAARESMPPESVLYFKQLRQERILRPI